MKRTRFLMTMLTVLMSMAAWSADGDTFNFSYTGSTLSYYVISESEKTCMVTGASSITSTGALSIPSTANGYTVTIIGSEAFEGNGIISSVTIPSTVKSIYGQAFKDCSKLVSVTIPGNVESILREAFRRCTNLTTVTMREGVKTLGDGVFKECSALVTINFPNTITSLGESVFSGTEWVSNLPEGVTYIGTIAYKYIESSSTTSVTLKDGTTQIFNFAFYNYKGSNITSVSIPNTVTTIGKEAFESCYYLTTINFPTSLTTIGDRAFMSCSSLTSVELPSSATNLGTSIFSSCTGLESATLPSGIKTIGSSMFSGCTKLSNFTMPESVTSVGDAAFYECESLTSIDLTRLYTIGQMAFERCVGLTSIDIPKARTIGIRAFSGCTGLKEVTIPSTVTTMETWDNCWAFSSCAGLRKITIEDGAKLLGTNTFNGCYYVETVISYCKEPISVYDSFKSFASNATLYVPSGCAEAYKADSYWKDFSKIVEMEDGVDYSSVGNTFAVDGITYKISNVKPLEVQVGLRTGAIDESYEGSLTIPSTVTGTDGKVYTCTSICYGAFSDNYNITSITIPNTVESISNNALNYDLPKLVVNWETPIAVSASIGIGVNQSSCILYVPAGTRDAYAKADYWKDFKEIVELGAPAVGIQFADAKVKALCVANWDTNGDGELSEDEAAAVTDLGDVFQGNKEITSFNELQYFSGLQCNDKDLSGNTYSGIPYFAFMGCTNLKQVTLPNVEAIGHAAFSGSGLTAITIPSSVRIIIDEAFYNTNISDFVLPASVTDLCDSYNVAGIISSPNLKSIVVESGNPVYDSRNNCNAIVRTASNQLINGCATTTIPATVTSIRQYAFMGCQGLTAITIPISVTSIGGFAFEGCNNLTSVTVENPMPFTIGDGAFSNCANATLHVPAGSKAAYKDADGWKEFKEIVEPVVPGSADTPFTCAEAVTFVSGLTTDTPTETEYYVKGKICKIQHNYGYQYGNASFWISDNGTDNGSFYVYRTLYFEKEKYNGGRVPNIGDEVVLCGKMINYQGTTPETYVNQCRLVSLNNKTVGTALEVGELFVAKTPEDVEMFFVVDNTGKSMGMTTVTGCSVGYAVGDRPETYTNAPACIDPSYNGPITIPETVEGLSVQVVAPSAFAGTMLTAVTMPASIWDVETNAFSGCTKLASVKMPENVILNNGTFKNCTSLTSVELPKGIQLWANDVIFKGCTNLTTITVNDEVPYELQGSYVVDDPTSVTLYVPAGCADAYKAADYWKEFKEIIEKGPEVATTEIWTGSYKITEWNGWGLSEEELPELNVGDLLHIEVSGVLEGATSDNWSAFLCLYDGQWTNIERWSVLDENTTEVTYSLTGDMVRLLKAYGIVLTGVGYTVKHVYTTPTDYVGSENSIWLGRQTKDQFDIDPMHFLNANRKTNVKAGDILRLSYTGSGKPNIFYFGKDSEGTWKNFTDAVLEPTETGADVTVTGSMAKLLCNNSLIVQVGDADITMTQVELISGAHTVIYKVGEGETFASGSQIEQDNIILAYGETGGADFEIAKAWTCKAEGVEFPFYTPGNGINGNKDGGTFYVFSPKKNGLLTVVVKQNDQKKFFVEENGSMMAQFNGITHDGTYKGTYKIEVKANHTYKIYCAGSKLGFYGFIYDWRDNSSLIQIEFASNEVKQVCVAAFDTNGDGELSEAEAAAVTNEQFANVSFESVTADSWTFDELQYFTGLTVLNTKLAETKISSVKIPATVTEIGSDAFRKTLLTSITLPDAVKKVGERVFADCGELVTAKLGRVENIDVNAFIATSIVNLTVPGTVKAVGLEPFSWNWTMKQATLEEGMTKVPETMFHGNVNLTTVTLPSTLTTIEQRAFQQCEALTTISIPAGVTTIDEKAFNKCTSLVEVTVGNPTPVAITEEVFSNRKNATLYVPEGCVAAYKAADYWKEFKKILVVGTTDPVNETDVSQMPNAIYLDPLTGRVGRKFWAELKLKNEYAIRAYQFDLELPVGVTIATDEEGEYVYEQGARHEGIEPTLNYNETSSTYYMSVIDEVAAGEGVVWRLNLKIANGLTCGDYPIVVKNVKFTPADGQDTQAVPDATSRLTVEEHGYLKGDANDDDVVNIADVVCIVNHSVHLDTPVFVETSADVTGNGEADLTDAVKIIDYILRRVDALAPALDMPMFNVPALAPSLEVPNGMELPASSPDISNLTDAIYADDLIVKSGQTYPLMISLKNSKTTNGYQFDLVLPSGVTIPKNDKGKYSCELSSRHKGHTIDVNYVGGVYKVAVYSLSSKALTGNDGAICTIQLNVADDMVDGNYTIAIKEAAYSLTSGASWVSLPRADIALTVKNSVKGDVNNDGKVTITDAVGVVNYILGNPAKDFNEDAADVNGDGNITITDAVGIVNIILSGSPSAPKLEAPEPEVLYDPE